MERVEKMDSQVVALCDLLLHGTDGATKVAAAQALGARGDVSAVPALVEALGEADTNRVKEAVLRALGKLGAAEAVDDVIDFIDYEDDVKLIRRALSTLVAIGDPGSADYVVTIMEMYEMRTNRKEARFLAAFGGPWSIPLIVRSMDRWPQYDGGVAIDVGIAAALEVWNREVAPLLHSDDFPGVDVTRLSPELLAEIIATATTAGVLDAPDS